MTEIINDTGIAVEQVANPFAIVQRDESITASASVVESSRAIAEVQASMVMAKNFPRDEKKAIEKILESCRRPSFAQGALYSYPKGGGENIKGASIKLAQEIARCWGNLSYGIKELSRREGSPETGGKGYSEMQVYSQDLETMTRTTQEFTVWHVRETKTKGIVKLTSPRDIYEITANEGARRLRSNIFKVVPPDVIELAIEQIEITKKQMSPAQLKQSIEKLPMAFNAMGVSRVMIEAKIGKKIEQAGVDDINELRDIHASIKEGHTQVADWFDSSASTVISQDSQGLLSKAVPAPVQQKVVE
jgi:hypothetical protein